MSAQDKLKKLKDMVRFPTSQDREVFDMWEKRISKSEKYSSWLNNPITKEIVLATIENIKEVNRIALETGLTEELRTRREVWSDFLHLFNPSADIGKIVEAEIEQGIEAYSNYYGK